MGGGAGISLLRAGCVAALSCAALPAAAAASGLQTGCDSAQPAVAYRIGSGALAPQPTRALVPCLEVVSGRTSESANVGALPSGRILYAPLIENEYPAPLDDGGPAVVAASDDGGSTWQTLESGNSASPFRYLDVPPWMDVNPQTHRIWFATALPDLCGGDISWSDDGGQTWEANPLVGCPAMGSESVIEGPAPAGGAQPTGYPHVVYYCANLSDLSQSDLYCYRSLDGGPSFSFVGSFPDGEAQPSCSTEHPARPGAVGPDGDLYFPVFYCGDLSVAISRDEGASWQFVHVANSNVQDLYTTSVAIDAKGNVYLAWIAGQGSESTDADGVMGSGQPMLSISRNHGASWSTPVAVGPPGLEDAEEIAITAAGPGGKIAISYLANTDGSTLRDGWLSETNDALSSTALWWAAPLNDPSTPLINTTNSTTFGNRLFFATDTFAPDGEPWAAFHCAETAACPGERIGVVGRLAPERAR